MRRDIDISAYLPPFMVEYRELGKTLEVQNIELQRLEDRHWQEIDNRYITTADKDGIARFEELLGLTASDGDSLEIRRQKVISKWNDALPYNYAYLVKLLNANCGEGKYLIDLSKIKQYTLILRLMPDKKDAIVELVRKIEAILPANIIIDDSVIYDKDTGVYVGQAYKLTKIVTPTDKSAHDPMSGMTLFIYATGVLSDGGEALSDEEDPLIDGIIDGCLLTDKTGSVLYMATA